MDLEGLLRCACQYEGALTLLILAVLLLHHIEIREARRQIGILWDRHLQGKGKGNGDG